MLWAQEDFVNLDMQCRSGESDPYETCFTDRASLFRACRQNYGRCTGKVYVDTPTGPRAIGWVFVKREKYSDSDETFLQEAWVTVHGGPARRTTTYQYA